jgi:hypothetical protein
VCFTNFRTTGIERTLRHARALADAVDADPGLELLSRWADALSPSVAPRRRRAASCKLRLVVVERVLTRPCTGKGAR